MVYSGSYIHDSKVEYDLNCITLTVRQAIVFVSAATTLSQYWIQSDGISKHT